MSRRCFGTGSELVANAVYGTSWIDEKSSGCDLGGAPGATHSSERGESGQEARVDFGSSTLVEEQIRARVRCWEGVSGFRADLSGDESKPSGELENLLGAVEQAVEVTVERAAATPGAEAVAEASPERHVREDLEGEQSPRE